MHSHGPGVIFGRKVVESRPVIAGRATKDGIYDPTNGAVTTGDVVRLGP